MSGRRLEGPLVERLKLFFLRRVLMNGRRTAESLGIRLATEGPLTLPARTGGRRWTSSSRGPAPARA